MWAPPSVYFFSLSKCRLKFSLPLVEILKREDPFGSVSHVGQSSCTGTHYRLSDHMLGDKEKVTWQISYHNSSEMEPPASGQSCSDTSKACKS